MTGFTWTFGFCETCFKNSHKKVKLVRRKIISGDAESKNSKGLWVCPACGATKKL
ncbi:MAG: hypothetical protein NZ942_01040 [Candidatus Aenigmarchaeota archaeon]|nr:hypothetical protein [Candidatus Aenigmarchaeota archaeon]